MMKPLKSVARRAGLVAVAGCSAFALAACGAGQISQTSNQVAAVDGASAENEDGTIAVRDVQVIIENDGAAGLKFTAVNQDTSGAMHTLRSVSVDGTAVDLSKNPELGRDCSLVADTPQNVAAMPKAENACITYVASTLPNAGYAPGGNVDVSFVFDTGTLDTVATVAANHNESFSDNRDVKK